MVVRHPYLDNTSPIAFAHRGGTSAAPENTLRAFNDAVTLGYRYIETDVHATSDGKLVAFHDNDLQRTCGKPWRIEETDWSTLSTARIAGTDPIPLLIDLLTTWPDVRINIDCKSDAAMQPLIDTIRSTNCLDRICVGSFSDKRLRHIRSELGPGLCTSMGPKEVARLVLGSTTGIPINPSQHALVAQVPVRQGPIPVVTRKSIARAHQLGLQVHVWTIDDPIEIGQLLDLGVDGVMSDDTRALKDVFVARKLW
ncbi:MAG: glycerophosphodiester phosphodiesterase [Ilumatobacteraceae bacterium]|nr:glycerophosphodiester phosphodiesterase [Ilumatobacteraceae bacterium]